MRRKIRRNWIVPEGAELTDLDRKILAFQEEGFLVPSRKLIKTPEQIEGIRRSGVVNTGVLDLVAQEIHAGMTTLEIDEMVYDYTVSHGAIPAPLNYEGFPKSVCTSINEEVCHGIPHRRRMDGLHGKAHGIPRQARRHPPHLQHGKAAFHRSHRRLAL